jgi:hypothetical protein
MCICGVQLIVQCTILDPPSEGPLKHIGFRVLRRHCLCFASPLPVFCVATAHVLRRHCPFFVSPLPVFYLASPRELCRRGLCFASSLPVTVSATVRLTKYLCHGYIHEVGCKPELNS